VQKTPN